MTNKVKRLTEDEQPLSGVEVRYQSLGNLSTDLDVEGSESVIYKCNFALPHAVISRLFQIV